MALADVFRHREGVKAEVHELLGILDSQRCGGRCSKSPLRDLYMWRNNKVNTDMGDIEKVDGRGSGVSSQSAVKSSIFDMAT